MKTPDHYSAFAIAPAHFILANRMGFAEGNVIKYVCRHEMKGGREDLLKAIDYIEMIIKTEYDSET